LFLLDNTSANRALATQKKPAYLGFHWLDHTSYSPDLAPLDYYVFPGLEKTFDRSPFFVRSGSHCCRGDLSGRTSFWFFFEWLAEVRATAQAVYWASWGMCWMNSEFGRCSLFSSRSCQVLINTPSWIVCDTLQQTPLPAICKTFLLLLAPMPVIAFFTRPVILRIFTYGLLELNFYSSSYMQRLCSPSLNPVTFYKLQPIACTLADCVGRSMDQRVGV